MSLNDIENRFTYHAPKPGQVEKYKSIRDKALSFAQTLVLLVPESRELSTALTHLDKVVMFANAGIARNS